MYLSHIDIENFGPLAKLSRSLQFHDNGDPKPTIFVGGNGAGKSLLIAAVVETIISIRQTYFKDREVEEGFVYKFKSPKYIRFNENYYAIRIEFSNGAWRREAQLSNKFEYAKLNYKCVPYPDIFENKLDASSGESNNFDISNKEFYNESLNSTLLYFPPNRFEEPAWLNIENLMRPASYSDSKRLTGWTHRNIIQYSPLRENESWLLDVIYFSHALEKKSRILFDAVAGLRNEIYRDGEATNILQLISEFLGILFNLSTNKFTYSLGERARKSISLIHENKMIVNNLFSMSTGQSLLFNIFFSIIRDADIGYNGASDVSNIKGIVIIDEIDVHLHSNMQYKILPFLIKMFPKVQFIITTHSPLFLMGLKNEIGSEGFNLISLPDNEEIDVERFSEFEHAYNCFRDTMIFERELQEKIKNSLSPIVFTEGSIDVDYIKQAASLLGREASLARLRLENGEGWPNLDSIWKQLHSNLSKVVGNKVILLYDCDVKNRNETKGDAYRRTIPSQPHKIKDGIENLFSDQTLDKVREHCPAAIDIEAARTDLVRGQEIVKEERWTVNKDEKRNLCNWLIENGDESDFAGFSVIFDILDQILAPPPPQEGSEITPPG